MPVVCRRRHVYRNVRGLRTARGVVAGDNYDTRDRERDDECNCCADPASIHGEEYCRWPPD